MKVVSGNRSGFSLVEVMISLLVLMIGMLSLGPLLISSEKIRSSTDNQTLVRNTAARAIDEAMATGFTSLGPRSGTEMPNQPLGIQSATYTVDTPGQYIRSITVDVVDSNGTAYNDGENPVYRLVSYRAAD